MVYVLTKLDKNLIISQMKKFLVVLAVVAVIAGAVGFCCLNKNDIDLDASLKSEIFFVSTNQTLPFEKVFTNDLSENSLSSLRTNSNEIVDINNDNFYSKNVGSALISYNDDGNNTCFKIVVLENPQFINKNFTLTNMNKNISGFVGEEIAVFNTNGNTAYFAKSSEKCSFSTSTGKVKLLTEGKYNLTLYFQYDNFTFTSTNIAIESKPKVFASSVLVPSSLTLNLNGESHNLGQTVFPYNFNQEISFTSENNLVASIDKNGLITPVCIGETNVVLRVKASENHWLDYTTHIVVENEINNIELKVYDNSFQEISSIQKQEETETRSFYVVANLDFTSNNIETILSSNANINILNKTVLTSEKTITFNVSVELVSSFSFTCTSIQSWDNHQDVTKQSNTVIINVCSQAETFTFVAQNNELENEQVFESPYQNDTYFLFYDANIQSSLSVSKTKFVIKKNFTRELFIDINQIDEVINIIGDTIMAKGIGQATIRIYDLLSKVEEKIINFVVQEIFTNPISSSAIEIKTFNNLPYEPYQFEIPTLNAYLSNLTSITAISNMGLFQISDNNICAISSGEDGLCFMLFGEQIYSIPVIITNEMISLTITYATAETYAPLTTNSITVNSTELRIVVSLSNENLAFDCLLYQDTVDNLVSTSDLGIVTYNNSLKKLNKITMYFTKTTSFVLRIYILNQPEIFIDIEIIVL